MLPAPALILICPFCKGEKPVLQLDSGNTFGGEQWSDLKTIYPMMRNVSPIQQCPHCGKYYFASHAESKQGNDISLDEGNLTYEQIKEAVNQYDNVALTQDEEKTLRIMYIRIYNDKFQRENVSHDAQPTEEDKALFRKQVLRSMQVRNKGEDVVCAELYREIGEFEQAIRILDPLTFDEPIMQYYASQIRQLAESGQTYAFQIKYVTKK